MGINQSQPPDLVLMGGVIAEEIRMSFAAASQLSCQILPRFYSTRESGFSSISLRLMLAVIVGSIPQTWSGVHLPKRDETCFSALRD